MARKRRPSTYNQKTLYMNDGRRAMITQAHRMFPDESDSEMLFRALQVRMEHAGIQERVRALEAALQAAANLLALEGLMGKQLADGRAIGDVLRPLMAAAPPDKG